MNVFSAHTNRMLMLATAGLLTLWLMFSWATPAANGAGDITLTPFADGLDQPVFVTHANDNSGRLFVVEKGGTIRIVQNGTVLPTPFLDITDRVGNHGEAGLLSVAFPPNYASAGYFFVYYNHADQNLVPPPAGEENEGYDTVVARFRVTGDPNRADPASESRILLRNQPWENHNGGLVAFGPDGYLYIGLGDGGSGGDPLNSGQRRNTLLGKLLRIQVGATGGYTIPSDNPFANTPNVAPEIWDLGLRNPWRWSFDRTTGDLLIGDVGQGNYEEIDIHPAGQPGGLNFGWRCREGLHPYNNDPPCPGPLTDPIVEYDHGVGWSVTGGYVYRGAAYPQLRGRYFYADFGSGRLWSIHQTANGWTTPTMELDTNYAIASFGEDQAGELYVVEFGSGVIYRLTATAPPAPILAGTKNPNPTTASPGQLVLYTVQLTNAGAPIASVRLTDVLPAGLTYVPGSFTASTGTTDAAAAPQLRWQGALATGGAATLAYEAIVAPNTQGVLRNTANVSGGDAPRSSLTSAITVTPAVSGGDPDFFLPGSQPHSLVDAIADPGVCQGCHTEPIYGAWRGSLMSQAGRDPLLWAALAVANADEPNAGEYCLRCHTPRGWFAGHSHPADGAALQDDEIAAGVACETCHRLVDPAPVVPATDVAAARDVVLRAAISPTLPADHVGSAMLILDPLDNRRGPFTINPAPPHPRATWQTGFLGQGGNPVVEARVCGSCHNVDNPALSWDPGRNQYWPNEPDTPAPSFAAGDLFPVERTYDEWLHSAYATAQGVYAPQFAGSKPDGIVRTCQDCHMPRTTGMAAIGDVNRDCQTNGCLPAHTLMGGNTWTPQLLKEPRWRLNAAGDGKELDAATIGGAFAVAESRHHHRHPCYERDAKDRHRAGAQ